MNSRSKKLFIAVSAGEAEGTEQAVSAGRLWGFAVTQTLSCAQRKGKVTPAACRAAFPELPLSGGIELCGGG